MQDFVHPQSAVGKPKIRVVGCMMPDDECIVSKTPNLPWLLVFWKVSEGKKGTCASVYDVSEGSCQANLCPKVQLPVFQLMSLVAG